MESTIFQVSKPLIYKDGEFLLNQALLKRIQFFDFKPDKNTLKVLNEVVFKNRKELILRIYGYPGSWADISFLEKLPELERFDWDTDLFGAIKPLYKLKKLVRLGLGTHQPKPKISINFLADFVDTIEEINIAGDFNDLNTVSLLKNLKLAWFASTKLKGFDLLAGLPIETLGNYGSRVESFDFVKNLKTIKKLRIHTNNKLENIDFIKHLGNLEELELVYVSKLTQFPACAHLKNLKKVFIFECNRLSDIEELKKLKNCEISVSGAKLPNRVYSSY